MRDVIDVLKKSYIIIPMKIWKNGGQPSGPRKIAFGFGIMKGRGFEFHADAPCNGMAVHGSDVGFSSPAVVNGMLCLQPAIGSPESGLRVGTPVALILLPVIHQKLLRP
jgi:hypothetical protein